MANLRVVAFLLLSASALAAQHVSCRTNYYAVTGDDLRQIHESFRQARPWRATGGHDGFAAWNVNWRFGTAHDGAVCRVTGFSTTTTISITLPRWIATTNASDSLKAEWVRYIRALGQHEYGHAQLALAAAGEMQKLVRELSGDSSCEGLKQRVTGLCESVAQKYKQMDVAYDQRTNHGLNDGARLARRPRPEITPPSR